MLIGLVVAVAAAAVIGFFGLGNTKPPAPVLPTASTQPKPAATQPPAPGTLPVQRQDGGGATAPPSVPMPAPQVGVPQPTNPVTVEQRAREAADMKIGEILAQNPTVEGSRDRLLVLFPSMGPFEKIAAAPHINNLVSDEQVPTVVNFLKNPNTPAEAQETFFNDMLNRPPQVGWPVLIDVMSATNHPLAGRARELLTTILGQDYGTNIDAWKKGLQEQLKLQGAIPDDPQPASTPAPAGTQ